MSDLTEKKFINSEALKPYDAFAKKIPITYTEGCLRHIAKPLNRELSDTAPHFGYVITDPQYEDVVHKAILRYKVILAVECLTTIYGEHQYVPEKSDKITEGLVDEILMRYYPSSYDWVISNDGRGMNNGLDADLREFGSAYMEMMNRDPAKRKRYFEIDKKTGDLVHKGLKF